MKTYTEEEVRGLVEAFSRLLHECSICNGTGWVGHGAGNSPCEFCSYEEGKDPITKAKQALTTFKKQNGEGK